MECYFLVIIILSKQRIQMQSYIHRLKLIQKLFKNNQNYHAFQKIYRDEVNEGNVQMITDIVLLIEATIRDDQCDPFSKLLALRFIKDTLSCASYSFLTLVNSVITEILYQILVLWKNCNSNNIQEQRGQQIFLSYLSYDEIYLRRVGVSFYKIILQMYKTMSQLLPYYPFNNTEQYKIPSKFYNHFKELRQQNIKFPEHNTYYKDNNIEKIKKSLQKIQINKEQMQNFYHYLTKDIDQPQIYGIKIKLIVKIIQSGDQHCVDYFIKFIQFSIDKSKQIFYVKFAGEMIRSGDIQSIIKIQRYVMLPFLRLYSEQKLCQKDIYQLCSWGFLIETLKQNNFQNFKQVSELIKEYQKQDFKTQIRKFRQNIRALEQNNRIKLKYLKRNTDNKQLQNFIKQLKNNRNARLIDNFQVQSINLQPQSQQIRCSSLYRGKNLKSKRLMSVQRTKRSQHTQLIKMQQSQKLQQLISSVKGKQLSSQKNQMSQKSSKLYKILDYQKPRKKYTQQQIQIKDKQNIKRKKQKKIRLSDQPKLQVYKQKKRLLKKKILILRSEDVQLGLITQSNNNILVLNFFCTSYTNLHYLTFKIKHNVMWLQPVQNPIYTLSKLDNKQQKSFKFQFDTIKYLQNNFKYDKPLLQFRFNKQNHQDLYQYQIQLPIAVNKLFCDIETTKEQFISCFSLINESEKKCLSKKIHLQCKVCLKYMNFINYFPHALQLEDDKDFMALLTGLNIDFYFKIKILPKNQALLQIIPKNYGGRYQKVQQTLKVLLNTFCQIFSI